MVKTKKGQKNHQGNNWQSIAWIRKKHSMKGPEVKDYDPEKEYCFILSD